MFRSQFIVLTSFVFCAFGDALATPVSFSEVLDLGVEADHVWRPYGTHSQQTLVHFPQNGVNERSVLLIHGGCWSNASSSQPFSTNFSADSGLMKSSLI